MIRALAFLIFLLLPGAAFAQGQQCRTSPVGASTAYCASEAFVTESLAAGVLGPASSVVGDLASFADASGKVLADSGVSSAAIVTEQKNTAGAGLSTSGNCDNTSTNATNPCKYTATGAPYFSVQQNTSQPITSTPTKVTFDTVVLNVGSAWSATNHNFNPQVAATYSICSNITVGGTNTAGSQFGYQISKNGSGTPVMQTFNSFVVSNSIQTVGGCIDVAMNGSTDTIEVDAFSTGSAPVLAGNTVPYRVTFSGHLVGP